MRAGFDLDGVLDNPTIAVLARVLLQGGHEVHVISGLFSESGAWQGVEEKKAKMSRIGIPYRMADDAPVVMFGQFLPVFSHFSVSGQPMPGDLTDRTMEPMYCTPAVGPVAVLHLIQSEDNGHDLEYRLRDIGMRKGALSEKLGLDIFIDDSEIYCKAMATMDGGVTILRVM